MPATFHWDNYNRFGEKCKSVIFRFEMAAISKVKVILGQILGQGASYPQQCPCHVSLEQT